MYYNKLLILEFEISFVGINLEEKTLTQITLCEDYKYYKLTSSYAY